MARVAPLSRWISLVLMLLLLGAVAPSARADSTSEEDRPVDPRLMAAGLVTYDDWVASQEPDCRAGNIRCLTNLVHEMERTYDRIGCEHQAVFSLLYLRTTEGIRDAIADGHFDDPHFLTHQGYVFGRYYLDPYRAWTQGRYDEVPDAWRIAFDAEAEKKVSVVGNMMLGINAHVNRDLPFVLASIGMVSHDGTSRKDDHDAVNDVLAQTRPVVVPEIIEYLDPSLPPIDPDEPPDTTVPEWRETAWDNAQRLAKARTQDEWDAVAAEIEDYAAFMARVFVASFPLEDDAREARDAHCADARG